jgi:hypothetical protein
MLAPPGTPAHDEKIFFVPQMFTNMNMAKPLEEWAGVEMRG